MAGHTLDFLMGQLQHSTDRQVFRGRLSRLPKEGRKEGRFRTLVKTRGGLVQSSLLQILRITLSLSVAQIDIATQMELERFGYSLSASRDKLLFRREKEAAIPSLDRYASKSKSYLLSFCGYLTADCPIFRITQTLLRFAVRDGPGTPISFM